MAKRFTWRLEQVRRLKGREEERKQQDLAEALAQCAAISIIGGGDTVAAVIQSGVAEKMSHLSTGGGATLEFLEGKKLPGILSLEQDR